MFGFIGLPVSLILLLRKCLVFLFLLFMKKQFRDPTVSRRQSSLTNLFTNLSTSQSGEQKFELFRLQFLLGLYIFF